MEYRKLRGREDEVRFRTLIAIVLFVFGILILRLIWLQVILSGSYAQKAANNSTRVIPDRACRGVLFDRNLEVLVNNVPSYTVSVIPADLRNKEKVIAELAKMLDLNEQEILDKLEKQKYRVFEAVKLKSDVTSQIVSIIEEHSLDLPGVIVHTEPKRNYAYKSTACHVLGYTGEAGMEELGTGKYSIGDIIGRAGVEKRYDKELRGENGSREIVVDSNGRQIKPAGSKAFVKGADFVLTIDMKLQKACEDLVKGRRGAIIAMNPKNGEIYALVSTPGYDPNIFNGRLDRKEWSALSDNPEQPFLNRAIGGSYSPGSTYKIVPATAALEEKLLTERDLFVCHGIYWYSDWNYNCWKLDGHGSVNIIEALCYSCDIFFYQAGLLVKVSKLADYAKLYGFGSETLIDLDGERKGVVPTAEWKERQHNAHWFPGNTIQLSIGQGYLLATPLQMLNSYNIIANNGSLFKPHIVKYAGDREVKPELIKQVALKPETLAVIKKGLWEAVNRPGGTGWRAKSNFSIAGKTATIENPHGPAHASFIGFAPFNNPEISVIAFFEGSGTGGGEAAAPVVKSVVESYFKIKKEKYAKSASKDF
ncbi:MAG: penicillin-binding protein 2 [Candidatus Firestonebacteria bacterium]